MDVVRVRHGVIALGCLAAAVLFGCSKPATVRTVKPQATGIVRDAPAVLRGTIGARSALRGVQNTLVSGYGIVVNLNGTGGGDIDASIQTTMERELGLREIGKGNPMPGTALYNKLTGQGLSPREMLADKSVAVVVVRAVIPPGAPEGLAFDVYVTALNATSIEGGTLWSTNLRLGEPSVFGAVQTRKLAVANGPVYINAFAEPGATDDGITRTVGRVLDGGVLVNPLNIEIVLDNPSSALASRITKVVNSRFPERPGEITPTARGRSADSVAITIPREYRDRPGDFVKTLQFITIDNRFPDELARRYVQAMKDEPGLASELSWALVGLGEPARKHLGGTNGLYNSSSLVLQMAGLRAGAMLGDPRAAVALEEIARKAPSTLVRSEAITLLAMLAAGPRVDVALRDLSKSEELNVRVAAYEGLAERAERAQLRRLVQRELAQSGVEEFATPGWVLQARAESWIPPNSIQGVTREWIEGKFFLDQMVGGRSLVYITQQGQPRIVLFGDEPQLNRPLYVSMWSDRLMLTCDSEGGPVRIRYHDERTGMVTSGRVEPYYADLIRFMAHETTPEDPRPGLGMSYSEVVGALYEISRAGGTDAAFATEEDRLLSTLIEASRELTMIERPERSTDAPRVSRSEGPEREPLTKPRETTDKVPTVVPIVPREKES